MKFLSLLALLASTLFAPQVYAQALGSPDILDLTGTLFGYLSLSIFVLAYLFVVLEDRIHLSKSKPVMVAAGLIWILVGIAYAANGDQQTAGNALRAAILEYAELFLFLLSAMTFVSVLEERHVFLELRSWLISRDFSLKKVFWLTGTLTFLLSPIADNLSAALLMGAVVMAVGGRTPVFVNLGCINVVVAANAGGVFSPFGDITSLMVWQRGVVEFYQFFYLVIPAAINWLVPALILSFFIPNGPPQGAHQIQRMKKGGLVVIGLFIGTAALSVLVQAQLGLPPVLGMMTGLGVLKLYGFYLSHHDPVLSDMEFRQHHADAMSNTRHLKGDHIQVVRRFDMFRVVERASWDTLMFFYGIVLCIAGLASLGYLSLISLHVYDNLGTMTSHTILGLLSALIDNIPMMYALLSMDQTQTTAEWLLATLAIGTGGSLLAIGSAAGIALMGQASGIYTFASHLRWSWAILLGYIASVFAHQLLAKFLIGV